MILLIINSVFSYAQSPGGIGTGNLEVWIRANDDVYENNGATDLAESGDYVFQWNDQSGGNHHVFDATATNSEPIYLTNVLNYNPGVDFDGVNDELEQNTSGWYGDEQYIVFISDGIVSRTSAARSVFSADADNYGGSPNDVWRVITGAFTVTSTNEVITCAGGGSADYRSFYNSNTASFPAAHPYLFTCRENSAGNNMIMYKDGLQLSNGNTGTYNQVTNEPFTLGNRHGGGNNDFDGKIMELISISSRSNDALKRRVESYLGIKYGFTLDNTGGGTMGDYVASNGTDTYWDASTETTYHNDVIGIGRDNNTNLLQKQSHTRDDISRLYVGSLSGTNEGNTGSVTTDVSYITIGHQGGVLYAAGSTEKPLSILSRIDREWKLTNTRFSDTYSIDITLDALAGLGSITPSDLRLLVDTDSDLSDGTVYAAGGGLSFSYSNPVVTISGISTTQFPSNSTLYFTLGSASASTPLPVKLVDFTANLVHKSVDLKWTTASEINNDYFIVEKSLDGIVWGKVLVRDGAGNSSTLLNYYDVDTSPYTGISYYRLKQVDFNGQFEYSQIRSVNFERLENSSIELYPNPVNNQLTITGSKTELKNIIIYNILGQDVTKLTKQISHNESKLIIDLSILNTGTYYIKTKTSANKVYKQ